MKRIKVKKQLGDYLYDLEGSLDDAIELLKNLKEKNSQYDKIWFEVDCDWDSRQLNLYAEMDETDAQYEHRMNRQKTMELHEKETYERLKAKFEGSK